MPSMYSLPIRGELWICVRDAHGTRPRMPVSSFGPADGLSPDAAAEPGRHVAVGGHGYIGVLPQEGNDLRIFRDDAGEPSPKPVSIAMPEDMTSVEVVRFRGDIAYVGGRSTIDPGSRLGWFDLNRENPTWNPLEPREVVAKNTRPVCEILEDGDRLLAIDAGFTPKLALVFDISIPGDPRLERYVRIPSGIKDDIVNGAVGRSNLALLSSSHHEEGKAWKVGIYDREMLDEMTTIYVHADWQTPLEIPGAVAMVDDLLLIAHGSRGLGVVRIDDQTPSRFEHLPSVRPWTNPYISLDVLRYYPPLGQGRVVDVIPGPTPNDVYIVVKRGSNTWWEEVHLFDEDMLPSLDGDVESLPPA